MSVESVLMDFQVTPCLDDAIYIRDVATIATCVAEALRQDCLEQGCISSAFSYSAIYSGPKDSMFTIKHYFREGLITLSMEYFRINQSDAMFYNFDEIENLKNLIIHDLDANSGKTLPAIKRCLTHSPYLRTSDDRILEYGWKKLLFSERSPYQKVEIYQTDDWGACLVLDGYINLAESDLAYTRGLMDHGNMDYKDKQILILGGGDGALLHELLKEKSPPSFVTMVDIDEAVIRGCKEHMKSVCGDVLEKMEGDKFKIIVDDALKWLETYTKEEKKFDVIFGDLTDIPVHSRDTQTWAFVRKVIRSSLLLLPVGGKYLTHCNGKSAANSLSMFEKLVADLGVPVEVATTEHYIPSFQEKWVFYQLTRKEGDVVEPTTAVTENGELPNEAEKSGDQTVNGTAEKESKEEATKSDKPKPADEKEEKKTKSPTPKASEEKKDESKGAKNLKASLDSPKDKSSGLKKEKSNLDKKAKK